MKEALCQLSQPPEVQRNAFYQRRAWRLNAACLHARTLRYTWPMRVRLVVYVFAPLVALCAAVACGGDGASKRTPTVGGVGTIKPIPTPPGTVATGTDIRSVDLRAVPAVQQALADTRGRLVQSDVRYDDVTGDRVAEAVVPIESGGTQGAVAVLVLTPEGASARALLEVQGSGLVASVEGGALVITEPAPGPDDPECCPSMLKRTTYTWDGSQLKPGETTTVPNPDGAKPTSTPAAPGGPGTAASTPARPGPQPVQ